MILGTVTCGELSYLFMMNYYALPLALAPRMQETGGITIFSNFHQSSASWKGNKPIKMRISCQAHLRNTHVSLVIRRLVDDLICRWPTVGVRAEREPPRGGEIAPSEAAGRDGRRADGI